MTQNSLQPSAPSQFSGSAADESSSSPQACPQQLPPIRSILGQTMQDMPHNLWYRSLPCQQQLPSDSLHSPSVSSVAGLPDASLGLPPTPDTWSLQSTPNLSPALLPGRQGRRSSQGHRQVAKTELCPECGRNMNDARHVKQLKERNSRREEQDHRRDMEDMQMGYANLRGSRQQTEGNGNFAGLRGVKPDIDSTARRNMQTLLDRVYKDYALRGDLEGFFRLIQEGEADDPLVELPDNDRCRKAETCQKRKKHKHANHNDKMCITHGEPDWRKCHERRRDWRCAIKFARWHARNNLPIPIDKMHFFARVDLKALAMQLQMEGFVPNFAIPSKSSASKRSARL